MRRLDFPVVDRVIVHFDGGAAGGLTAGDELIPVVEVGDIYLRRPAAGNPTERRRVIFMSSAPAVAMKSWECLDLMTPAI